MQVRSSASPSSHRRPGRGRPAHLGASRLRVKGAVTELVSTAPERGANVVEKKHTRQRGTGRRGAHHQPSPDTPPWPPAPDPAPRSPSRASTPSSERLRERHLMVRTGIYRL